MIVSDVTPGTSAIFSNWLKHLLNAMPRKKSLSDDSAIPVRKWTM